MYHLAHNSPVAFKFVPQISAPENGIPNILCYIIAVTEYPMYSYVDLLSPRNLPAYFPVPENALLSIIIGLLSYDLNHSAVALLS